MTDNRSNITGLLPNKVLARLERMRVNPRQRNTNKHRGEHLSGRGGTSTEFSDYRDYTPGDDTRFIDWNIYSRLRRPYLKQFHLEEEMHIVIIVDATNSMNFGGKFDLARQVAAAFGLMGLFGTEKVSIYSLQNPDGRRPHCLPPCQGRVNMRKMFTFIENLELGGYCPLEEGVEQVLKFHNGKGVAVLLSDFMTFGDMRRAFNALFSAGLETYAIQLLSPAEIDPELSGDVRFIDCESEANLDVSAVGDLLHLYHEHRLSHEHELLTICQQRSGRFISLNSDDSIETVLFDNLLRRGWIK